MSNGIVMYTDGSARPTNPGFNGWGVHGYLYKKELPTKGAGIPTHILTEKGYYHKKDNLKDNLNEVTPLFYFDCFGSSLDFNSNNVAEISGMQNALMKASEYEITDLTIFTDSEYVRKGVVEWSATWIRRNWIKADGTPVPNSDNWKKLLAEYENIKRKGVNVTITWIKAHADNLGNELADKMATLGAMFSMGRELKSEFKTTISSGYWKEESKKHPFMCNKRMYFNTQKSTQVAGEYYMGDHGKDDELLGKKSNDGHFSIVQLEEPEPMLEKVREHHSNLSNERNTIIMLRLDKLFNPEIYDDIVDYGDKALVPIDIKRGLDFSSLDRKPVSVELRPARLAYIAVESISYLLEKLNWFKLNEANTFNYETSNNIQSQDITSLFYFNELVKKKKKTDENSFTLKLKPEFIVGFNKLPIEINHKVIGDVKKVKMSLALGVDLPDRNALKHLEVLNPTVNLITWSEGDTSIRYAVVIKENESYGIWAGIYTNLVFF